MNRNVVADTGANAKVWKSYRMDVIDLLILSASTIAKPPPVPSSLLNILYIRGAVEWKLKLENVSEVVTNCEGRLHGEGELSLT